MRYINVLGTLFKTNMKKKIVVYFFFNLYSFIKTKN